ncbi:MAG: YfhO family protein [Clostridium fessum]
MYGVLLLFFYASFSFNVLNFIWHGFHYPNSLPCRQSFIYIALVLTMCFRAYLYLDEISKAAVCRGNIRCDWLRDSGRKAGDGRCV